MRQLLFLSTLVSSCLAFGFINLSFPTVFVGEPSTVSWDNATALPVSLTLLLTNSTSGGWAIASGVYDTEYVWMPWSGSNDSFVMRLVDGNGDESSSLPFLILDPNVEIQPLINETELSASNTTSSSNATFSGNITSSDNSTSLNNATSSDNATFSGNTTSSNNTTFSGNTTFPDNSTSSHSTTSPDSEFASQTNFTNTTDTSISLTLSPRSAMVSFLGVAASNIEYPPLQTFNAASSVVTNNFAAPSSFLEAASTFQLPPLQTVNAPSSELTDNFNAPSSFPTATANVGPAASSGFIITINSPSSTGAAVIFPSETAVAASSGLTYNFAAPSSFPTATLGAAAASIITVTVETIILASPTIGALSAEIWSASPSSFTDFSLADSEDNVSSSEEKREGVELGGKQVISLTVDPQNSTLMSNLTSKSVSTPSTSANSSTQNTGNVTLNSESQIRLAISITIVISLFLIFTSIVSFEYGKRAALASISSTPSHNCAESFRGEASLLTTCSRKGLSLDLEMGERTNGREMVEPVSAIERDENSGRDGQGGKGGVWRGSLVKSIYEMA
ncbi:hypothetical protein EG329_004318 [Mollisiaceae sp. DMI_Dod_QoI]|nr:hypothetical protein EG329_004318 [Helotiales sp. DMI_Dod_QoI]